ncbi:MFS transporter [Pelotomaculum propionicicum]|uniref:4-hydroxybenzoate transporter PcaK n=1 Tax=Pelotomaculum propionicicum TaxID=258475 RepID=A0A4Y7RN94_9FIRM|nr:MFS transporter [Pelotomaculum propionicicum]NLI11059.1 MFS transporter [Peptococcaceae bacterium]TEB10333.1 4-hydroxybenzoate transporter PcaK [Pelotomaculum propionicicum]
MGEAAVKVSSNQYFDNAPIGKVQKKFLWFAAIAYFFDQMDNNTFSYVAPKLREVMGLTMKQIGDINALAFLGMFFGAIFGGWLADKIGRKNGLLSCIAIFSIASIANGLTNNYHMFCVSRFMTGFGVIGMVVIAMVYISEMLPAATRGKYQALTIAFGTAGIPVCATFAKWVIPQGLDGWRFVFILGGLSILLIPVGLSWLKESPRWLVSKGKISEAAKIIEEVVPGRKIELVVADEKKAGVIDALRVMFHAAYLKRTIVLFILANGITVAIFLKAAWYPTLLKEFGFTTQLSLMIAAVQAYAFPFGDAATSLISDRGGRKIPIIILALLCAGITLIMAYDMTPWVQMVSGFAKTMVATGVMTLLWTYLAESYPTKVRSTATGIMFGSARLSTSAAMLYIPALAVAYGIKGIFLLLATLYAVPAILVLFIGESTGKRSLEDINATGEEILAR